jgi:integrase
MPRVKLTAGRLREFSTDKAQAFLWDTEVPGLAVRATPSGTKAYIYQGRLNGKVIRITLGDVQSWYMESVCDEHGNEIQRGARQEARRLQSLIDQGIDPREEKRERRQEHAARQVKALEAKVSIETAWAEYIEARRQKWSAVTLANHQKMVRKGGMPRTRGRKPGQPDTTIAGPLHRLMSRPLSTLDENAVSEWLAEEVKKGPTQAEQAFRILRTFINWCAEHAAYRNVVHADACKSKSLLEKIPKVKPKDDCLQREQLKPWFDAVKRLPPVTSAYLQTLMLVGARREEWAALKWADVDFQWHSLTIHDKVEGERTIPLTPYVAALLSSLPRRNEWVFSSATGMTGRLTEPRNAHVRALTLAGLPHVSIHGLRRSFGTLAEWTEAPVGVVAQIMGHKPSALAEKHYRRRPLDLLRMWHSRIEAWILEEAGIQQPKEGEQGLRLVHGGL